MAEKIVPSSQAPVGGAARAAGVPARPASPNWSAKTISRFKPLLFLLGLYPVMRWVWLGTHDGLTANPVEFLTRSSGTWAIVCLMVTLAVTPLRRLLKQPGLVRLRRMCGLFAFFYAALHFTAWVYWDRALDPSLMIQDVYERPFITVGFAAFVLLCVLAATSTQGWMKRLGKRWQKLHRAVYLIGGLVVLHYWWHKAGKNDFFEPSIYAGILAVLLGFRVVVWLRHRRASR